MNLSGGEGNHGSRPFGMCLLLAAAVLTVWPVAAGGEAAAGALAGTVAGELPGEAAAPAPFSEKGYEPRPVDPTAHRNALQRFIDYFSRANEDRTFEKRIDFSFIGGPNYSPTTQLGIGIMAAGLFRIDRTDSVTPPSNVSLYASGSITGFYTVGIRGNTIFRDARDRIDYRISFSSQPTHFWGIGYDAGRVNPRSSYSERHSRIEGRYAHRFAPGLYAGLALEFVYAKGVDFTRPAYLEGMKHAYTNTGIGLLVEYDTRDFIPNPYRGIYLSAAATLYPDPLNTCGATLWRVLFTASAYRRVWPSALLAAELYGEFNSSRTPWPFMARLGGDTRMRGYYEGRYIDADLLTIQLELRQHIWRRISGVVWVGGGNVFPDFQRFAWSQTLPNWGVGFRWEFKKRVNVRFDLGFGRKAAGLVMQLNEAF